MFKTTGFRGLKFQLLHEKGDSNFEGCYKDNWSKKDKNGNEDEINMMMMMTIG